MERKNYEKILPILKEEFAKDEFKILEFGITNLKYKDAPANVDIFPFDKGYSKTPLKGNEYKTFQKNIQKIKRLSKKHIKKALKANKSIDKIVKNKM